MLNIILKDSLVYFSEESRTAYDLDNTQLLFSLADLENGEIVKNAARPFKALWIPKKDMYKKEIIDHLPDILYSGYTPIPTSLEEHERIVSEVKNIALMMGLDIMIPRDYEIIYECDTWNTIEDGYGPKITQLFKDFLILPTPEQELVRKVWRSGKNRRTDVAREGNWTAVLDLLPVSTQSELLIFGDEDSEAGNESSVLEFRRKEKIGPTLPNLKNEIYKEFKLGEFLLEGAQEVKDRLGKIYEKCGVERSPKAKDLEDWFVIIPCRSKGKRGFRIDFRK